MKYHFWNQQSFNLGKDSGLWKPEGDKDECGKSISGTLIVGGREAKIGQFPWMALLGYDPSAVSGSEIFYLCGGSVINKHYVLTAAHCINTENGFPMYVQLILIFYCSFPFTVDF